ncbi:MAG: S9 family peptidase, partial [Gemmatimonadota bacterium]|nr:S9 family peptidase [Gemmatimonadota bacterium]
MSIRRLAAPFLALAALLVPPSGLAAQDAYRTPTPDVVDILDAAPFPQAVVSPSGDWMILAHGEAMPGIEDLAAPMLRLAGRRISPVTNGMHAAPPFVRFSVVDLDGGSTRDVTGAEDGLGPPLWSPAGDNFAFTRTTSEGVALWLADPQTGTARALTSPSLNGARGEPCAWMPDGGSLLCHYLVEGRGAPPVPAAIPIGPVIQESGGEAAPSWTFQDLLEDAHDEALFDYYLTSQPTLVDVATGATPPMGAPAVS